MVSQKFLKDWIVKIAGKALIERDTRFRGTPGPELLSLMIDLDREWYGDGNPDESKDRVVNHLKSLESSKYLG